MEDNSISAALLGFFVWKNNIKSINNFKEWLILIVPKFDEKLLEVLPCVLSGFLSTNGYYDDKICIVCSDVMVHKALLNFKFKFTMLSNKKMYYLLNYLNLSSKCYGVMCMRNVKIISLENLFGGQLRTMENNQLFPVSNLLLEKILMRE